MVDRLLNALRGQLIFSKVLFVKICGFSNIGLVSKGYLGFRQTYITDLFAKIDNDF